MTSEQTFKITNQNTIHLVIETRIDLSQQPKTIANIDSVSKKYLMWKKFLEQSLYSKALDCFPRHTTAPCGTQLKLTVCAAG